MSLPRQEPGLAQGKVGLWRGWEGWVPGRSTVPGILPRGDRDLDLLPLRFQGPQPHCSWPSGKAE